MVKEIVVKNGKEQAQLAAIFEKWIDEGQTGQELVVESDYDFRGEKLNRYVNSLALKLKWRYNIIHFIEKE